MEHLKLSWKLHPRLTTVWAAVTSYLFYFMGSIFYGLI